MDSECLFKDYYEVFNLNEFKKIELVSPQDAPYWVLDTDYTNYSVVWSCSTYRFMNLSNRIYFNYWLLKRNMDTCVRLFQKYFGFWHGIPFLMMQLFGRRLRSWIGMVSVVAHYLGLIKKTVPVESLSHSTKNDCHQDVVISFTTSNIVMTYTIVWFFYNDWWFPMLKIRLIYSNLIYYFVSPNTMFKRIIRSRLFTIKEM